MARGIIYRSEKEKGAKSNFNIQKNEKKRKKNRKPFLRNYKNRESRALTRNQTNVDAERQQALETSISDTRYSIHTHTRARTRRVLGIFPIPPFLAPYFSPFLSSSPSSSFVPPRSEF